jgi:hypothetical protein
MVLRRKGQAVEETLLRPLLAITVVLSLCDVLGRLVIGSGEDGRL